MTAATRSTKPRKQPRQQRAHDTRARILDAAARVFAERGYAGGTTNHIAAEAGLSVGSLYQYFPNKDALLAELTRAHIRAGADAVQAHLAALGDRPGGIDGWLRVIVDAMVEVHLHDHRLHRVLFEEAPRPPDIVAELRATDQWAIAAARELLAAEPGIVVADLDLAARMVVTTIESLVHRFVARDGEHLDPDAFATEVVTMLGGYLRAGGSRSDGARSQ